LRQEQKDKKSPEGRNKEFSMKMVKAAVIFTAALAFGSAFSACNTSAESKTYTVTWKNYDGAVLETDTDVAEGVTPRMTAQRPPNPRMRIIPIVFPAGTPPPHR
jgi:hypothetical protein